MAAQPTLIASVVRALSLLDVVAAEDQPVPAKRLARLTGIPLATVYHLVRTLLHEGYLERVDGGYVLGEDACALGERGTVPARTRQRARRILARLRDETGAASYLAVLDDGEVVITDIADSPAAPRVDLWVGFHEAAHATALGKAVLAAMPDDARRDYLAQHRLEDLTPHTVTDVRRLLRELADLPGRAVDREEYALGAVCLAVPVPAPGVTGAVAISVPAGRAGHLEARLGPLQRAARLVALAAEGPAGERPAGITM